MKWLTGSIWLNCFYIYDQFNSLDLIWLYVMTAQTSSKRKNKDICYIHSVLKWHVIAI